MTNYIEWVDSYIKVPLNTLALFPFITNKYHNNVIVFLIFLFSFFSYYPKQTEIVIFFLCMNQVLYVESLFFVTPQISHKLLRINCFNS